MVMWVLLLLIPAAVVVVGIIAAICYAVFRDKNKG